MILKMCIFFTQKEVLFKVKLINLIHIECSNITFRWYCLKSVSETFRRYENFKMSKAHKFRKYHSNFPKINISHYFRISERISHFEASDRFVRPTQHVTQIAYKTRS